jgi:hypothetical protein
LTETYYTDKRAAGSKSLIIRIHSPGRKTIGGVDRGDAAFAGRLPAKTGFRLRGPKGGSRWSQESNGYVHRMNILIFLFISGM